MSQLQINNIQKERLQKRSFDQMHMVSEIFPVGEATSSNVLMHALVNNGRNLKGSELIVSEQTGLLDVESQNERLVRKKQKKLVDQTCDYLKKRIHEKHLLDEVACSMGTNRSKLAASFKSVLGKGVFEWLRERRMAKAKALLLTSELSIQQIAFEVGFDNCANFSTAFKKQYSISPREQRSTGVFRV